MSIMETNPLKTYFKDDITAVYYIKYHIIILLNDILSPMYLTNHNKHDYNNVFKIQKELIYVKSMF